MPLTKVERAADPSSRASTAISTVKGTRVFQCRLIRKSHARCPPGRMDCLRNGKRCKRNDDRAARARQRTLVPVWQDDLAFADFNSDFDTLWLATPLLRGRLHLSGIGPNLR
jgi:hypothetical protein